MSLNHSKCEHHQLMTLDSFLGSAITLNNHLQSRQLYINIYTTILKDFTYSSKFTIISEKIITTEDHNNSNSSDVKIKQAESQYAQIGLQRGMLERVISGAHKSRISTKITLKTLSYTGAPDPVVTRSRQVDMSSKHAYQRRLALKTPGDEIDSRNAGKVEDMPPNVNPGSST